jgi:TonB family protein
MTVFASMLTSFSMRHPRNRRRASLWIGLWGSVAAHVVLLGGALVLGRGAPAHESLDIATFELATVTVTPLEALPPQDLADLGDPPLDPAVADPPPPRPWDAPAGENDNPVAITVAPRAGDAPIDVRPAPDSGDRGGRPPEHAYRRDRSVLHARLDDGAAENQAARTRTSRRPSSPQAIRREPLVGIGDSVRTLAPARVLAADKSRPTRVLALGGDPGGAGEQDSPGARGVAAVSATRIAADPTRVRTVGQLDAESGVRSFDVERPGQAADDRTLRAASDERHPGLTDFSRPAAVADRPSAEGRGPGAGPGAVARASEGVAAAVFGARNPRQLGPEVDERTLDRRYDRYKLEIRQRVEAVREFPKALALRMEQGETVLRFTVDVDGRLVDGPRVVKSSGFAEFDAAALRAVSRAAPFPPMSDPRTARPLSVSMPVTFDNPVVR